MAFVFVQKVKVSAIYMNNGKKINYVTCVGRIEYKLLGNGINQLSFCPFPSNLYQI